MRSISFRGETAMAPADDRARLTLAQGGFSPGQLVCLKGDGSHGCHSAVIKEWLDDKQVWSIELQGTSTRVLAKAAELRLEGVASDYGALDLSAEKCSDSDAWRGGQAVELACVGDVVEVKIGDDWQNATVVTDFDCKRDNTCRVMLIAGLQECVVPLSRLRRKEGCLLHQKRLVVCKLVEAKLEKKCLTDDDMVEILRQWPFAENPVRTNVIPEGKTWVHSDTFGLIKPKRLATAVASGLTTNYPVMLTFFSKYFKDTHGTFPFTSVNVNYNYAARIHRDRGNCGPSFIKAFGDFTGGELNYFSNDDGSLPLSLIPRSERECVDISKNWKLFDGLRAHSVQPYQGERFSLVYYSTKYKAAHRKTANTLRKLGVNWPTERSLKSFRQKLGVPCGFKSKRRITGKTPSGGVRSQTTKSGRFVRVKKQVVKYKLLNFPHLNFKLDLGSVYTEQNLIKRCKGDLTKLEALRRKLLDPNTFQVVLDDARA